MLKMSAVKGNVGVGWPKSVFLSFVLIIFLKQIEKILGCSKFLVLANPRRV